MSPQANQQQLNPAPTGQAGPKIVALPGVGNVQFPATMSDEDIATEIKNFSQPDARDSILKPGSKDEDIIRHYGYDPAVIKSSKLYSPNGLSELITDPNNKDALPAAEHAILNSPLGGAGYGLLSAATGTGQLLTHILNKAGVASDATAQYVDLASKVLADDYHRNIREGQDTSKIPEIIGQSLVPLPGGGGVLGGMAAGATAAAIQPVDVPPGQSYFGPKAEQVGIGSLLGGGLGGATKLGGKVINATKGNIAPAAQQVLDQGAQYGVRVPYPDATQGPFAQKVGTLMENVPLIGMAGERVAQQQEVQKAAKGVLSGLQSRAAKESFGGLAGVY